MESHPPQTRPWAMAELAELDRTPLIRVAGARADGTLRAFVLIGHVRLGQDELIRSLNGTQGVWYRGAVGSGWGEIEVGASESHSLAIRAERPRWIGRYATATATTPVSVR